MATDKNSDIMVWSSYDKSDFGSPVVTFSVVVIIFGDVLRGCVVRWYLVVVCFVVGVVVGIETVDETLSEVALVNACEVEEDKTFEVDDNVEFDVVNEIDTVELVVTDLVTGVVFSVVVVFGCDSVGCCVPPPGDAVDTLCSGMYGSPGCAIVVSASALFGVSCTVVSPPRLVNVLLKTVVMDDDVDVGNELLSFGKRSEEVIEWKSLVDIVALNVVTGTVYVLLSCIVEDSKVDNKVCEFVTTAVSMDSVVKTDDFVTAELDIDVCMVER